MFTLAVLLFFIITLIAIIFLLQGPPFVPTRNNEIDHMLKLADIKKGQKMIDIGSGDGRIVIAMAQAGAKADGIEINPWLVWQSRRNIQKTHIKNAHIYWKNFWNADISQYDIVTIYGVKQIMPALEKKLQKELKPGTKVISKFFTFPNWEPKKRIDNIILYEKT